MNVEKSIVAARIYQLRNEHQLTQAEFARIINIDSDLVSKIERDQRKLTIENAIEISKQFHVSLDWLYGLDESRGKAGKDAASILLNLKDIFSVSATEMYMEFPYHTVQYPYYKLSISQPLDQLLRTITEAEIFRRDKGLPEEAYNGWINGAKRQYNENCKENATQETVEWVAVPKDDMTEELLKAVCENAFKAKQAASPGNHHL